MYKGLHTGLNMPVAIKMLRHNLKACCRDPNGRHQDVFKTINSLQVLDKEIGLKEYYNSNKKYNMASLFMAYKDEQEFEFKYLIDQIYSKAKELGIVLKSIEFTDI